jgi:hypothetical protein
VAAPLSAAAVRLAGAKLTTAAGLLLIAAGLWQVSHATVTWTYTSLLPGLIMTGIGAALVMPAVSGSVMGSLHAIQSTILGWIGGALGVAARVGGATGRLLAQVARAAFISGTDLGLLAAAAVVLAACVLALAVLPASPSAGAGRAAGARAARRPASGDHGTDRDREAS